MLRWNQVWKHMRELTKREVEKRAVMEIINYFEHQIDTVIKQSVTEFEKINELKKIQGLHTKKRIDQDCIKNAIKTINNNGHSSVSKQTGGMIPKEKRNEKHPKKDALTEVT
jgi:hypothetical protein